MISRTIVSPSRVVLLAAVVALVAPARASADFILSSLFGNHRFGENGAIKQTYALANWFMVHEELGTHVVDERSGVVYQLTNSLGLIGTIPFNVDSGAFLGGIYQNSSGQLDFQPYTGGAVPFDLTSLPNNRVLRPAAPVFHADSSAASNDLYIVSTPSVPFGTPANSTIKRFDGDTGGFVQSLASPGGGAVISDIAFGRLNRLYAATTSGIYVYRRSGGSFVAPQLLVPGVTGQIASGPGGSLFVRSSSTISRYDELTGASQGTFLTAAALGVDTLMGFDFADDGTLYVLSSRNQSPLGFGNAVSRVNGSTGQVISTVSIVDSPFSEDLVVLPVPEPAGATLAALGLAVLVWRRRN